MKRRWVVTLGVLFGASVAGTLGCANWTKLSFGDAKSPLTTGTLPPDVVVIDTGFVRVPLDDAALEESIWLAADELVVDAPTRKRLVANGIRVGVVGARMPQALKKLIDQQAAQNPLEDPAEATGDRTNTDVSSRVQRRQCRKGARTQIVASGERPETPVFEVDDDGRVHGSTLERAVCQLGMKVFPQGDGAVRIELTPEIEHGEVRNKYVAQDGAFALQPARDRKVLERLRTEVVLMPGQFLLIGAAPTSSGLGGRFFTETENAATPRRTILALRVVQTQDDARFSMPVVQAGVATAASE